MALGVGGTGPYGRIRTLRREISDYKYELWLISEGMKRQFSKKKLEELISANRAEIRKINKKEKQRKTKTR